MARFRRAVSVLLTLALLVVSVQFVAASPSGADHGGGLTHDEAAFRAAIGPHTFEDFDAIAAGTLITTQVPGATFSTPGEPLYVFSGSVTGHVLFGGFQREAAGLPQVFEAKFGAPVSAVGFSLAAQDPASSAATLQIAYSDGSSASFSVSDNDGNENTPQYLGHIAPSGKRISGFKLSSGIEHGSGLAEEVAIDNLAFATAAASGELVAYVGTDPENGDDDIFVTDVVSGTTRNLTEDHPGHDSDPEFSPDGSKIVFASDRDGGMDLFVMRADGSDVTNITNSPFTYDADPAWSPDGTQIAFARDYGIDEDNAYGFDIHVMPATGGTPRQVSFATTFLGGGFPQWSPDGTRVVYRTDRLGAEEIFESTIGSPGGDVVERNLTNTPDVVDTTPSFSPDGSAIVYSRDGDLWTMDPDGGSQQPLLEQEGDDLFPKWSPDGDRILFDSGGDIHVLTLATGAVASITNNGSNNRAADWGGVADARSLSLTVSSASTLPGASFVDPDDIPVTALPLSVQSDVADTPLRSVDIAASPLRSVPLRSVPLRSVPLRSVPLRSVLLSDIPLRSVSTSWEAILESTPLRSVPLQNITLEEVLALTPVPGGLQSLTLADIDLGSTPLRSVSMVSLAMGSTPLRSVDVVPDDGLTGFESWCAVITGLGYSCTTLGLTAESPILAVDLAGIPLRSVPLRSVPLRSVPLRSVDVAALPLRSVPLRSVPLRSVPIGTIPLRSVSPVPAVVECGTPAIDCASLTATLADAERADAIRADATLGTLFDSVAPDDLPGSLLELLQGLVNRADYAWESLPVERIGVHDYAGPSAPTLTYTATFTASRTGSGTARVRLPRGFRYVAGSTSEATGISGEPTGSGASVEWTIEPVAEGQVVTWTFRARPSLSLVGGATSSLRVDLGVAPVTAVGQAPVSVNEDFESGGNDMPSGAAAISPNTLVISHIASAGDVDYFKLPVPPKGTRIQVRLGNDSDDADFDVALLTDAASTPLRSVPLRSVPLRSVPVADTGVSYHAADEFVSAETLDDIPNTEIGSTPLRSVSQNRDGADELIDTTSDLNPATSSHYLIQVTAFNAGSSPAPYVLYVKQYAPPTPPACAPRPSVTYAAPAPATIPPTTKTLILTSPSRLVDRFGSNALEASDVDRLAQLPGVDGLVYAIEAAPGGAAALSDWDAHPCDPERANAVASSIGNIITAVRAAAPGLENIVIAGSDDIVPMARIADYTQLSNESDYTGSTLSSSRLGNPIAAALATQNILSDDPYGDLDPIPWLDHFLYVPELAVGRLVETPADMAAQIAQFEVANGVLDPQTALTTGYDFLEDGANAVNTALARRLPNGLRTLINHEWSRQALVDELFPTDPISGPKESPDIASVNAHYDHSRSLPAVGDRDRDETDLFTVADLRPHALPKRILFTMGCHAGLNIPDGYGAEVSEDWAQSYLGSDQKAAVYFANTGFGYGDTEAVALSERLMELFAERLDGSVTVGRAALLAKQAYFGSLGAYGPYDEKAMQEATFYGLPMYRIGAASAPTPAPATVTPATGPVPSVPSVAVNLDLSDSGDFAERTRGSTAHYVVAGGELTVAGTPRTPTTGESQVTQYRPIVPKTSVEVTSAANGLLAKGFLVTDLESRDAQTTPAVARPVVDLAANEGAPPAGDVAFPASISNVSTYLGANGPEQRLVLMPGQVFRDAGDAAGTAVQRLFTKIGGQVTYGAAGASDDNKQPFLTAVTATISGGQVSFGVNVTDASAIAQVVVMYRDVAASATSWQRLDLSDPDSNGRYEGAGAITGERVEYFVQAVDAAGNVGLTTNKGRYYTATLQLVTTPASPDGDNGYFKSPVEVGIVGQDGAEYTIAVDGGLPQHYRSPVRITADGPHTVTAASSTGLRGRLDLRIDRTPPAVRIDSVPLVSGGAATCSAFDATSGLFDSCKVTTSQSAAGTVVTATARDRAGNAASATVTYQAPALRLEGFFEPVNNLPTVNKAKRGSSVPTKFRVYDADGAKIIDPALLAVRVTTGVCTGQTQADTIETYTSAPAGSIRWDAAANHFVYVYKTEKTANVCRRVAVVAAATGVELKAFLILTT